MLLVVAAMLSMLGIVALAIDVITLYSARSETQRAADAAALAAAKMLVDMGVTTDPTATVPSAAQIDAATKAAQSVATNLAIGGRTVQTADVTVSFPGASTAAFVVNPKVTVTIQNASLPTFFSRIWSRAALTVRASATAEGYNPSDATAITGGAAAPVIARCVKPFIVPNCDPVHGGGTGCGGTAATLFDPTNGAITKPGAYPTGIIGAGFDLVANCGTGPGCGTGQQGPPGIGVNGGGSPFLRYYPADMPLASTACPSCSGATGFEQAIECCNPTPVSCGTTFTAPAVNQLAVDTTVFPEGGGGPAQDGVECLIHQSGGSGMDALNSSSPLSYPLQIQVGSGHPLKGSVLSANDLVTTSDSLVTVPVYDGAAAPGTSSVRIIGFLQVFIDRSFPGGGGWKAGEFHVTVVNVSGCGTSATGTAVASSGVVPVRLIQ
jgi:Putative Flp pilus-assembly TadE/G-like